MALSRRAPIDRFVVYGEQAYGSVCKGGASGKKKLLSRIPDVVGYLPNGKTGFVIEGKLIFRSDSKTKRASDLQKLAAQVREAKIRCPKAACIGLLYLVCRSTDPRNKKKTRTAPEDFFRKSIESLMVQLAEQGAVSLRTTAALPTGTGWLRHFTIPN